MEASSAEGVEASSAEETVEGIDYDTHFDDDYYEDVKASSAEDAEDVEDVEGAAAEESAELGIDYDYYFEYYYDYIYYGEGDQDDIFFVGKEEEGSAASADSLVYLRGEES